MSREDAIALIFLVAGICMIVATLSEAYKRRLKFKERELELTAKATAEKAAQYAAQAERLEQRVRVLERIATDKTTDLALGIEALRDPTVN